MAVWEIALWVLVLVASIAGIVAKDWRASIATLGCSVFVLVMLIMHAWR
jgi:hypothetical protein